MRSLFDQRRGLWHRVAVQMGLLALGAALVSGVAAAAPARMAAPPVNGKIAWETFRDSTQEIYVMNANGSHKTNITNDAAGNDYTPAWSPDGTKIAFGSNRDGTAHLFVMNADGSGQTRLTNTAGSDFDPAWSPDGTKIAFTRGFSPSDIWVMNADGSGATNVTNDSSDESEPAWSPDGTKIAFTSNASSDPGKTDIWVMNPDGSGRTELTNDHSSVDSDPAWSPDGTKIAFTSYRDGNAEIYVMNADGSGQTRLTNDPFQDNLPAWSPDGTKIVFTGQPDAGHLDIYSMNADGTGRTRLTTNVNSDSSPDWQRAHALLPVKAFFPVYFAGRLLKLEQFSVDPAAGLVVDVEVISGETVVYTGPIPLPPKDIQVVRDKAGRADGLSLPAVQVPDSDLSLPAVQLPAVQLPAGAKGHLQALGNALENGASTQALATLLNRTFGLMPGAGPYR